MDTVVNRALPSLYERALEISLTVPLNLTYNSDCLLGV